jgi:hypothetical protein
MDWKCVRGCARCLAQYHLIRLYSAYLKVDDGCRRSTRYIRRVGVRIKIMLGISKFKANAACDFFWH